MRDLGDDSRSPARDYVKRRDDIAKGEVNLFQILTCKSVTKEVCELVAPSLLKHAIKAASDRINLAIEAELIPPPFDQGQLDQSLEDDQCRMCGEPLSNKGRLRIQKIREYTRDKTTVKRATDRHRELTDGNFFLSPPQEVIEKVTALAQSVGAQLPDKGSSIPLKKPLQKSTQNGKLRKDIPMQKNY